MIGEVWLVGFYSLFSFVEWREHNATIAFSFFFLSALSFLHNSFLFLLAKKIWLLLLILFNCCCCCWRVIVVYEWVRLMECEEWRDGDDSIVTRVWNSMPRFPCLESTYLKVLCFFFFFFEMICFCFCSDHARFRDPVYRRWSTMDDRRAYFAFIFCCSEVWFCDSEIWDCFVSVSSMSVFFFFA